MPSYQSETLGFRPACECQEKDPVPCTVLDPFSGSGTTGKVALELGRSYIGIELNPEYAEMSRRRIRDAVGGALPGFGPVEVEHAASGT